MLDTFHRAEFLDECLQSRVIVNHNGDVAAKQSVVGIDVDGTQHQLLLFLDNAGQVVDNTDIVVANYSQCNCILRGTLAAPFSLDYAVAETLAQFRGVRTVSTVNLDASINGDKAEHGITVDGLSTTCQLIVDALHVFVNDQYVLGKLRV